MANRRVLFLCAHNQSRSVTAEGLLTGEKGFEVRSRALWKGTPRKVSVHDGQWATEVYVMMPGMKPVAMEAGIPDKKIHTLWVPDNFVVCERELIRLFRAQLKPFNIDPKKSDEQAVSDCLKVADRKMGWTGWGAGQAKTKKRVSDMWDWGEFDYVPMWHIEEGQKKALQEPKSKEQMLAEFEEAEAYHREREAEREKEATRHLFADQRAKDKELQEREMLDALEKYTKHVQKLFE